MTTATSDRRAPYWSYEDLGLFLAAVLPSVALGLLCLRGSRALAPRFFLSEAATILAFQVFMYAFLLGALYLLIAWRYRQPFWSSLDWAFPVPGMGLLLLAGPILTIVLSSLGVLVRAPVVRSQIEQMITGRWPFVIVTVFGILLAPMFEELIFRGFLFPLLARSVGPWLGIVLTSIPFALLHGAQNEWAWQQVTLIGLAGAVFGYVRHKTGLTSASFLVHASYNATGFVGFAVMHWTTLN